MARLGRGGDGGSGEEKMNKCMSPYQNLVRLWAEEDRLVKWAKTMIADEPFLQDHIELIETYMDCVDMLRQKLTSEDRIFALGGLFMRSFDNMGHAVRAAMSGNYSGSTMYARDLIETQFLISYLKDDPKLVTKWLKADTKEIKRDFKAVKIREHLDKRDGFSGAKRAKHFEVLSMLGPHPTPQAFNMKRDGAQQLQQGPFKQKELLSECLQETAKAALLLGGNLIVFCNEFPNGAKISSRLSLVLQRTHERYFQPE